MSLFKNVFIVLNENGETLERRLTKSTTFHEITDHLTSLKERLHTKETSLSMICIDDCYKNRNRYQKIIPDAEIKLDLFHACQRVLRTIEPGPALNLEKSLALYSDNKTILTKPVHEILQIERDRS